MFQETIEAVFPGGGGETVRKSLWVWFHDLKVRGIRIGHETVEFHDENIVCNNNLRHDEITVQC